MNIYHFETENIEDLLTGIRDNSHALDLALHGLHHLGRLDRSELNSITSILTDMEGKIRTVLGGMRPLSGRELDYSPER